MDRVHAGTGVTKHSAQGIKEIKTAATTIVGSVKPLAYGKEVVYARLGTATATVTKGQMLCGKAVVAHHMKVTAAVTASVGAVEVSLTIGATSCAKNFYKNGTLMVDTEGDFYMIQGNESAASAGTLKLYLKDGLEKAVAAQTLTCVPNPYDGCQVKNCATQTSVTVGVMLASAINTGNIYCYLGKKGQFPVRREGTWVVGEQLVIGCAEGTVRPMATADTTFQFIGRAMASAGSTFGLVDLDL